LPGRGPCWPLAAAGPAASYVISADLTVDRGMNASRLLVITPSSHQSQRSVESKKLELPIAPADLSRIPLAGIGSLDELPPLRR
jgi:hypothetical protein